MVKQTEIASRLIQGQANKIKRISLVDQLFPQNTVFPTYQGTGNRLQGTGNRLPGSVIDYQKTSLQTAFKKGFEI